ncbi:hypothetical protein CQJ30_15820 [Caldibacillus thermoamylovorans]|nr:hypothetical protein CQJ30_15820 [Caldibacillus thermoamylovorans]
MRLFTFFGYRNGGEKNMTLNILFVSITIKQREISLEEELHNQQVEKLYEQNQMRISTFMGNH